MISTKIWISLNFAVTCISIHIIPVNDYYATSLCHDLLNLILITCNNDLLVGLYAEFMTVINSTRLPAFIANHNIKHTFYTSMQINYLAQYNHYMPVGGAHYLLHFVFTIIKSQLDIFNHTFSECLIPNWSWEKYDVAFHFHLTYISLPIFSLLSILLPTVLFLFAIWSFFIC